MKEVEKEIGLVYSTNVFLLGMAEETSGKIYDLCLYLPIVKGREYPRSDSKKHVRQRRRYSGAEGR